MLLLQYKAQEPSADVKTVDSGYLRYVTYLHYLVTYLLSHVTVAPWTVP